MPQKKLKIAMLISGGVDSSVALALLREAGHQCHAYYMKIWLEDELQFLGECPWEDDLQYVQKVCDQLDVPLTVVPFQKEYWDRVVSYTIDSVKQGLTPNPDMMCNARVKFGAFYDYLSSHNPEPVEGFGTVGEYDFIATGHYADTEVHDGMTHLVMSPDPIKDQTYFLAQLTQEQIAKAMFPIGKYQKETVRELAARFNLPNAQRKDSQGICFLGKIPFDEFVKHHLGTEVGNIIEEGTGQVLGQHEGFWYYTVGQRKGIRLSGGPWYVMRKNIQTNEVFVAHGDTYNAEARDTFVIGSLNWITAAPSKTDLAVKLRHGEKMYQCTLRPLTEDTYQVTLDTKDQGIAAGQFAVLYDGTTCLGSGTILDQTL
jgi:tRNA-specific 2-thiouridylase